MNILELRRNGKYTCLDCKKVLSQLCQTCKNWDLFELDEEVIKLSYEEKSLRQSKMKKSGGIG